DCGMRATYDEYGYLKGEQIKEYDTTIKWNTFQKRWLIEHKDELKKQTEKPFSCDKGLRIYQIVSNERVLLKEDLTSEIFGDRFRLSDGNSFEMTFRWKDIGKIGMFRNNALYLTYDEDRYELFRTGGFPLIKYFSLWRVLTDKDLV
ncbi:MAG: hypothetical protein IKS69_06375, partial [Erysipelotrichaceae bacterium]|nr:hypothetical protein [Erysipelotrichaceae bacterium]